jgi:hypothetical protein
MKIHVDSVLPLDAEGWRQHAEQEARLVEAGYTRAERAYVIETEGGRLEGIAGDLIAPNLMPHLRWIGE